MLKKKKIGEIHVFKSSVTDKLHGVATIHHFPEYLIAMEKQEKQTEVAPICSNLNNLHFKMVTFPNFWQI